MLLQCRSGAATYAQESFPRRIISLGPSITEQLYLLGAGDKLIGCTEYCRRPPEAEKKEKIGTVMEVNLEKIVSLKPDLVFTTSLTNPKAIEKLRSLRIGVVNFPPPENFTQLCEQLLELGRICGKGKEAEEIVYKARDRVNAVKRKVENLPKSRVFIQVGARPLFTVTGGSFINDFIEIAGGINIAKDANSGLYSREEVLRKNPDVIMIVTMGIMGEEEKRAWGKFKVLNAVGNNRVFIVDSYKICSPTPVTFVGALEELIKILHPDEVEDK